LKESSRQGLSSNARQISATVVCEIPCFWAKPRSGPVRRIGRRGLKRLDQDHFDHVVTDRAGRARPRCINKSVETVKGEPMPPLADRRRMHTQQLSHLAVGVASAHDSTIRHRNAHHGVILEDIHDKLARILEATDAIERSSSQSWLTPIETSRLTRSGSRTRSRWPDHRA